MLEYEDGIQEAFGEATGLKADGPRNRAKWSRMMAAEVKKHGMARTKDIALAKVKR